MTRRYGRNAPRRQQTAEETPKSADFSVQRAAESARPLGLHVSLSGVRPQPAHGDHHRGTGARLPELWECEESGDFGLFESGGREQEEAAEDPTADSGVEDVGSLKGLLVCSYGFVHFAEKEAREKALIPAMRIFGVKIRDCLCRTEPAENKRTLFVGNIDHGVTGDEVSEELNALLKPQLQVEGCGKACSVDRAARCAVARRADNLCGLLLHRVRLPPAGEHVVRAAVRSGGEREGAEGGMGAGVERFAKKEAGASVGQVPSVRCF